MKTATPPSRADAAKAPAHAVAYPTAAARRGTAARRAVEPITPLALIGAVVAT